MSKENKTSDKQQNGNDFIADVSGSLRRQKAKEYANIYDDGYSSLRRQKAKEYAKFIYGDGYNDPMYHPDVMKTMKDFEAGFKAGLSFCNDR